MADIVQSLFGVTPELYQQAQAQRAAEQALQYAQLSPFQQANFAIGRGAYQLAGALGGTDPQLQMISTRNSIARQINYNDPESIMQGVQRLTQAGDTVGAMQLADVARKMESEMAQTFQRTAAGQASLAAAGRERQQATPEKIQLARELALAKGQPGTPEFAAEYNTQLTRLTTTSSAVATPEKIQLARELAAQVGAPGSPEYNAAYRTELTRLTTTERAEAMTPEMRNAAALASLKGAPGSPEFNAEYSAQLGRLTTKAEGREPTTPELTNARAVALQAGPAGSPEFNAAFAAEYKRLTAPKEGKEPTTAELTNARAVALQAGPVGSPEYNAAFDAEYRRLTAPKDVKEPTTAELTNARAIALQAGPVGSPEYNAAFMREYNRLTAPKDVQMPDAVRQYEYAKTPAGGSFKGTFEQWKATQTPKTTITVDARQQEAFAQKRGGSQAELLTEATANARTATQALSAIGSMKQLNATGELFTGPLANPYLGAANLLASVNLLGADQVGRLAKSEVYDKQAKDLVMNDLGGKLGAQISDADRKYVEARIPQLATSQKARTELLDKIEQIQRNKIEFYRKMNEHANKFGNLNTFDFAQQGAPITPAAGGNWSIRPAK